MRCWPRALQKIDVTHDSTCDIVVAPCDETSVRYPVWIAGACVVHEVSRPHLSIVPYYTRTFPRTKSHYICTTWQVIVRPRGMRMALVGFGAPPGMEPLVVHEQGWKPVKDETLQNSDIFSSNVEDCAYFREGFWFPRDQGKDACGIKHRS